MAPENPGKYGKSRLWFCIIFCQTRGLRARFFKILPSSKKVYFNLETFYYTVKPQTEVRKLSNKHTTEITIIQACVYFKYGSNPQTDCTK